MELRKAMEILTHYRNEFDDIAIVFKKKNKMELIVPNKTVVLSLEVDGGIKHNTTRKMIVKAKDFVQGCSLLMAKGCVEFKYGNTSDKMFVDAQYNLTLRSVEDERLVCRLQAYNNRSYYFLEGSTFEDNCTISQRELVRLQGMYKTTYDDVMKHNLHTKDYWNGSEKYNFDDYFIGVTLEGKTVSFCSWNDKEFVNTDIVDMVNNQKNRSRCSFIRRDVFDMLVNLYDGKEVMFNFLENDLFFFNADVRVLFRDVPQSEELNRYNVFKNAIEKGKLAISEKNRILKCNRHLFKQHMDVIGKINVFESINIGMVNNELFINQDQALSLPLEKLPNQWYGDDYECKNLKLSVSLLQKVSLYDNEQDMVDFYKNDRFLTVVFDETTIVTMFELNHLN